MNKQINTTDIVNKLKHLKPGKIILFGSYAKGNPDLDSDVDVLVIQKTQKNRRKGFPRCYDPSGEVFRTSKLKS